MITVYNKNEIYRNCYDILIYAYDWRRAEIKLEKEPVGNLSELIATCNSNLFTAFEELKKDLEFLETIYDDNYENYKFVDSAEIYLLFSRWHTAKIFYATEKTEENKTKLVKLQKIVDEVLEQMEDKILKK
jgi:hypothetical protein